ncbi:MAG: peptidoglycan-binding protein [Methyloligellaceae bacterium]
MAKKELKNNKSSSQEEEKSDMSTVCEVEAAREPHKLGSVLRQIVDQIDDAERSNTDTLQEMQARLTSLSEQTSEAKSGKEDVDAEALEKIETQIAGLSDRIEIISHGRAINADNLEGRIEALADTVSSAEKLKEQNTPKADIQEETGKNTDPVRTEQLQQDASGKTQEQQAPRAETTVQAPPAAREPLVEDADITFAVTDQLEQDGDFDPSELEAHQAFLDTPHQEVAGKSAEERQRLADYGIEHKIQASGYDNNSHLEPQRLASLAEHFSPVIKNDQEDESAPAEAAPAIQEPVKQSPQAQKPRPAKAGEVPAKEYAAPLQKEAKSQPSEENLEARFALIASRLEDTLAHNNRDIQEREEISTRFDELAHKFESWLSSNDQKDSFSSIEQRIDALTDYVRKAEANAARVEAMESQLVKLIDLVERNKPELFLQNDMSNSFADVASRILEEKSVQIADIIASKVGKSFETGISDERLNEIQRSISAISAERRRHSGEDSNNINAVNETLQSMSGRLSNIEEQIRLEKAFSAPDLKKNTDFEIEEKLPEEEEESDSFHDELELSVNEVIEDRSDDQVTSAPSDPNDLSHQKEFLPPPLMAQEPLFEASSEQPHFAPSIGADTPHNQDYVAAARRASQAAFERNQAEPPGHPGIEIENEGVLDRIREQTGRMVGKGADLKKRIFSFRPPSSTSVFVIGAISLMLICIGILFKELSSPGVSKPAQFARDGNKVLGSRVVPSAVRQQRNIQPRNGSLQQGQNTSGRSQYSTGATGRDSFRIPIRNRNQTETISSGDRIPADRYEIQKVIPVISPSDRPVKEQDLSKTGNQEVLTKRVAVIEADKPQQVNEKTESVKEETVAGLTVITDGSKRMQLYRVGQSAGSPTVNKYNLGNLPVIEGADRKTVSAAVPVKTDRPQYIKQLSPKLINGVHQVTLPPEQIGSMSLRTAAASGNFKAQFSVAMRYLRGDRVKQNYAAARRWLTRSASQSFAPAQFNLGILFERGLGVQKDIAKARTWYLRAANRGNVEAMHNLAVLYAQPTVSKPNYNEAILWFKQAANYGHSGSQYNLGILYKNSIGVQIDKPQAYKWFTLALARGVKNAAEQLTDLKNNMTKDEIFTAEAEIARWSRQTPNKSANLTEEEVLVYTGSIMPPFGNSKVYNAQRMLNKLGYDVGPVDGQIGPKTREAVKSFQLLNGMEATGTVTDRLISILNGQAS